MKTIHKYPLSILDEQEIEMPQFAKILTVQMQNDRPCLWARVEPNNYTTMVKILMRGTGHNAENLGRYIGTFQMENGGLVFHVFEDMPITAAGIRFQLPSED